jgi:NAD-reducing hydrogenase small subunit
MTAALPPLVPRLRLATVWLAGCSGCHMSFLDLDEALFTLAERFDLVHSPVASDRKRFPEGVDVCLVEGAVASEDNLAMARRLRRCSRLVVALGDCALSGNVTALRNQHPDGLAGMLQRCWGVPADRRDGVLPRLLERVLPLHAVIRVDSVLPGCPPGPERIWTLLESLR